MTIYEAGDAWAPMAPVTTQEAMDEIGADLDMLTTLTEGLDTNLFRMTAEDWAAITALLEGEGEEAYTMTIYTIEWGHGDAHGVYMTKDKAEWLTVAATMDEPVTMTVEHVTL